MRAQNTDNKTERPTRRRSASRKKPTRRKPGKTPACLQGRTPAQQPLVNLRSNAQRQWGDRASIGLVDLNQPTGTVASLAPNKPAYYIVLGIAIAIIAVSLLTTQTAEFQYYVVGNSFAATNSDETASSDASEGSSTTMSLFPDAVEYWRPTVAAACKDLDLGTEWEDTALAIMEAESGGNVNVSSVVGCSQDIMQAGEGCAGVNAGSRSVTLLGANGLAGWNAVPSIAVPANCATASIYAGVIEIKENIEHLESWLGPIDPDDVGKIGLIAQGYNYGCAGWSAYCQRNGITTWTYEASATYQSMQPGGTTAHGQKVMDAYAAARY